MQRKYGGKRLQVIAPALFIVIVLNEAKVRSHKLILLLFFSQYTPLHQCASDGRLEICRLLVAWKADVAARTRLRGPWRARHLLLTSCVAEWAKLHSNWPSTATKPTSLHTCAVLTLRYEAFLCPNVNSIIAPAHKSTNAMSQVASECFQFFHALQQRGHARGP